MSFNFASFHKNNNFCFYFQKFPNVPLPDFFSFQWVILVESTTMLVALWSCTWDTAVLFSWMLKSVYWNTHYDNVNTMNYFMNYYIFYLHLFKWLFISSCIIIIHYNTDIELRVFIQFKGSLTPGKIHSLFSSKDHDGQAVCLSLETNGWFHQQM